jgi:hypothetical protein
MNSNEVGTTLKHPETINGIVKNLSKMMKMKDKGECHFYLNLSKRMKMKDKGECHFYFKNLILPLITKVGKMDGVGTSLNRISKEK